MPFGAVRGLRFGALLTARGNRHGLESCSHQMKNSKVLLLLRLKFIRSDILHFLYNERLVIDVGHSLTNLISNIYVTTFQFCGQ